MKKILSLVFIIAFSLGQSAYASVAPEDLVDYWEYEKGGYVEETLIGAEGDKVLLYKFLGSSYDSGRPRLVLRMSGNKLKGIYKPYRIPLLNGIPTVDMIKKWGLQDSQLLIEGEVSPDGNTITLEYKAPYRDIQRGLQEFYEYVILELRRK